MRSVSSACRCVLCCVLCVVCCVLCVVCCVLCVDSLQHLMVRSLSGKFSSLFAVSMQRRSLALRETVSGEEKKKRREREREGEEGRGRGRGRERERD
jgi:hypothetical protein